MDRRCLTVHTEWEPQKCHDPRNGGGDTYESVKDPHNEFRCGAGFGGGC